MLNIGFDQCGINQLRAEGPWTMQFNPLRSLRPARNSQVKLQKVNQPFNADGFHFNKPFLVKEELWQGEIASTPCRILYNKFPFADFHALLVIDSKRNKKQWIEQHDISFLWQFQEYLIEHLPSLLIAYNSIGAYASINHQHFQLSLDRHNKTAISHTKWMHNGGKEPYPLPCKMAFDKDQAWSILKEILINCINFYDLSSHSILGAT